MYLMAACIGHLNGLLKEMHINNNLNWKEERKRSLTG